MKAVRYTQMLIGAASGADGPLVAVPGAAVLIRQNGDPCSVYGDNDMTPTTNPVPTGVPQGTAGVDVRGTLLVYLAPGRGYSGISTVGNVSTTFTIPDISPDVDDVAPSEPLRYSVRPGADDADVIETALLAALETGGVVDLGVNERYGVDRPMPTITRTDVSIEGVEVVIDYTGGADTECFSVRMNPWTVTQAGHIRGVTINLTGAGAGSFGIGYGDVVGLSFREVVVVGGTNGGWHEYNVDHFTERTTFEPGCWSNRSTPALLLSGPGSHSRLKLDDLRINLYMAQIGIDIAPGVFAFHCDWAFSGNVDGTAGNTAKCFRLQDGGGQVVNSTINGKMEQSSGSGATGVEIGTGAVLGYDGIIDMATMTVPLVNRGTLSRFTTIYNIVTAGGAVVVDSSKVIAATPVVQLILNGSITSLTFPAPAQGTVFHVALIQGAVGGKTVAWPGNFLFANNTPPAPASTANWRDVLSFYSDGTNCFEISRSLNNP